MQIKLKYLTILLLLFCITISCQNKINYNMNNTFNLHKSQKSRILSKNRTNDITFCCFRKKYFNISSFLTMIFVLCLFSISMNFLNCPKSLPSINLVIDSNISLLKEPMEINYYKKTQKNFYNIDYSNLTLNIKFSSFDTNYNFVPLDPNKDKFVKFEDVESGLLPLKEHLLQHLKATYWISDRGVWLRSDIHEMEGHAYADCGFNACKWNETRPNIFFENGKYINADIINKHPKSIVSIGLGLGLKYYIAKEIYQVQNFIEEILPFINRSFSLVAIYNVDATFPSQNNYSINTNDLIKLKNNRYFCGMSIKNNDGSMFNDGFFFLPIGVDNQPITWMPMDGDLLGKRKVSYLLSKAKKLAPPLEKCKKLIFIDKFQFSRECFKNYARQTRRGENPFSWGGEDMHERRCKHRSFYLIPLQKKSFKDLVYILKKRVPETEILERRKEYAFIFSPGGFGMDCHRHWEIIIHGKIVIAAYTPFISAFVKKYPQFPIVIINHPNEITRENLDKWYLENYNKTSLVNPEVDKMLTSDFWIEEHDRQAELFCRNKLIA